MTFELTEGSLQRILWEGAKDLQPTMQILASKSLPSGNSDKVRYRVMLSDGKNHFGSAMLTTQASLQPINLFSVIKINKYTTSILNNANKGNTQVLLVLEVDLLKCGTLIGKQIGNPTALPANPSSTTMNSEQAPVQKSETFSFSTNASNGEGSSKESHLNRSISDAPIINPISSLTPYHHKWVIKARVTNKSDIRTWSNSRGEGKLFNIDLLDESGEIRCTAFRDQVDKFYNFIKTDKVYYISKCQVKPANKQFSSIKNDYELTMGGETVVEECLSNEESLPQVKYNFLSIDKISGLDTGAIIDIMGVCKSFGDVQSFVSKSTNRELKKRDVVLVDQSKVAVTLTLWGSQAESFDGSANPVVVIKGAKVNEFGGGKSLSCLSSTQFRINPDIRECYRLKGWFDLEGREVQVENLSERSSFGNVQTEWMNLKEVQDRRLGHSEKGDYFQMVGTVLLIRSENALYKACPTSDCNKKVIDQENGMYRCEKCNREFPNFKYRLLVSMNIADSTANQWVSLFASEAEKILGKTSEEVGYAIENKSDKSAQIFNVANFKQFVFKCRVKAETYNDEQRLKTVVVNVDHVNFKQHNSYLIKKIKDRLLI